MTTVLLKTVFNKLRMRAVRLTPINYKLLSVFILRQLVLELFIAQGFFFKGTLYCTIRSQFKSHRLPDGTNLAIGCSSPLIFERFDAVRQNKTPRPLLNRFAPISINQRFSDNKPVFSAPFIISSNFRKGPGRIVPLKGKPWSKQIIESNPAASTSWMKLSGEDIPTPDNNTIRHIRTYLKGLLLVLARSWHGTCRSERALSASKN